MAESASLRLIAGLGNPGPEYTFTRHNVGFHVVDRLAAMFEATWEKAAKWEAVVAKAGSILLAKPMTYMNLSGHALRAISDFYKIAPGEVAVVTDDMALPLGKLRLRLEGGPGGHNGLESVICELGSEQFPRVRVGIGAPPPGYAADYVTGRFFEEERPVIASAIERAAEATKWAIDNGFVSAMNKFNSDNPPKDDSVRAGKVRDEQTKKEV